jgi:hypothetical protein
VVNLFLRVLRRSESNKTLESEQLEKYLRIGVRHRRVSDFCVSSRYGQQSEQWRHGWITGAFYRECNGVYLL